MEKIHIQFKFWVSVIFLKKTWHRTFVIENKIKLLELFCSFWIIYSHLPLYLMGICLRKKSQQTELGIQKHGANFWCAEIFPPKMGQSFHTKDGVKEAK